MSVWYCIPSKRPAVEAQRCIDAWRQMGYKVAVWRDDGDGPVICDFQHWGDYGGYAAAVNLLCRRVLEIEPPTTWLVTGGDDVYPDRSRDPGSIARECSEHFAGTFGVMQPTGDQWGKGHPPDGRPYAARVCGSPWMGADFCRRMYGGQGPLWPGWFHMFEDEELYEVARLLGALWQRPDLTHHHQHWGRADHGFASVNRMPDFLKKANAKFAADAAIFKARKAAGFPGHEPCAVI